MRSEATAHRRHSGQPSSCSGVSEQLCRFPYAKEPQSLPTLKPSPGPVRLQPGRRRPPPGHPSCRCRASHVFEANPFEEFGIGRTHMKAITATLLSRDSSAVAWRRTGRRPYWRFRAPGTAPAIRRAMEEVNSTLPSHKAGGRRHGASVGSGCRRFAQACAIPSVRSSKQTWMSSSRELPSPPRTDPAPHGRLEIAADIERVLRCRAALRGGPRRRQ